MAVKVEVEEDEEVQEVEEVEVSCGAPLYEASPRVIP